MLEYVNKQKVSCRAKKSEFMLYAVWLNAASQNEVAIKRINIAAKMWQFKKKVVEKRDQASKIFQALQGWKNAGKTWVAIRSFRQGIVRIQQWWREVRVRHRENRDYVIQRWVQLERAELAGTGIRQSSTKQRTGGMAGVALKHKTTCNLKLIQEAEAQRIRFVDGELRARRYHLLPQIQLWEEDRKAWRQEVDEWCERRRACSHSSTEDQGQNVPIFRWPPIRPSYVPPRHIHPPDVDCSDSCPGCQGDAEILDMCRRFRRDPESFTKIVEKREHQRSRKESDVEGAAGHKGYGLYGPPPSTAESRQLGGLTDMPGVHDIKVMAAIHGGEARAWLSQMAATASGEMVGFRPGTASITTSPGTSPLSRKAL